MCVIIIKNKRKLIPEEILENSSTINPHGLGVVWLDTYNIEYFESHQWEVLKTKRPFIAHFRYATVGKVSRENMHPFRCGVGSDEWLMQNGTISGYGNNNMTDTEDMAITLDMVKRDRWADWLSAYDCRFVTVNTKTKTYQIYNKEDWIRKDGVWYSKGNVLATNYIAVYGTLRHGNGNYYHYLYDAKYIGQGQTKDKYPLLIEGLPYVVDKKGTGHNVTVDVFRVTDEQLRDIDDLEGHPHWYCRKEIPISVGVKKKRTIKCWIYFNPKPITNDTVFHKEYPVTRTYGGWNGRGWDDWGQDLYDVKQEDDEVLAVCPSCEEEGCLEHDGYGTYYCYSCGDWITENELSWQE